MLLPNRYLLCGPMDCSPPGFSVHGISQARILEWVATFYSRRSRPRDRTCVSYVSCIGRRIPYHYHHLGSPPSKYTYDFLTHVIHIKSQRLRVILGWIYTYCKQWGLALEILNPSIDHRVPKLLVPKLFPNIGGETVFWCLQLCHLPIIFLLHMFLILIYSWWIDTFINI